MIHSTPNDEYLCDDCGKLTSSLRETDDYSWVCDDCFETHQDLTDPECNLLETEKI